MLLALRSTGDLSLISPDSLDGEYLQGPAAGLTHYRGQVTPLTSHYNIIQIIQIIHYYAEAAFWFEYSIL